MKAQDVRDAIQKTLASHACAVIFEVPDGLGKGLKSSRSADAIAVEFWESRGLEVAGFEIKVERGDWLRELQLKAKAEAHFVRCDRWSLVTPYRRNSETPIAKIEEIPGPWGWYVVKDGQLVAVKKPPKLVPSVPFDRHFAFALVRAAARYDDKRVADRVRAAEKGRDDNLTARVNAAAAQLAAGAGGAKPVDDKLTKALREAFGPSLDWIAEEAVVETLKVVRRLQKARTTPALEEAARSARAAAVDLDRLVELLKDARPE